MHISHVSALADNFIWMIEVDSKLVIVDPGESKPVLEFIQQHNFQPHAILITHHHFDHTGGITGILKHHDLPIYGPKSETIPHLTHAISGGDTINLPDMNLNFNIIDIPGHTLGHIGYNGHNVLFCGDTLFSAGCGRVLEGTIDQMYHSLKTLSTLPDTTLIYPGHEYTLSNLAFAKSIEPDNMALLKAHQDAENRLLRHQATVPTTLAYEKTINLFLRCHEPRLQTILDSNTELEAFTKLRHRKDQW